MNNVNRMSIAFLLSTMKAIADPAEHRMSTLYTLIPIYLESLRADMVTLRVSYAKKQPNSFFKHI